MMHRLYHFPLSPFSRKVRLVLAEKKIEVELIEERYWDPSPEFLRLNPAGRVPILRINNYTFCKVILYVNILRKNIQTIH